MTWTERIFLGIIRLWIENGQRYWSIVHNVPWFVKNTGWLESFGSYKWTTKDLSELSLHFYQAFGSIRCWYWVGMCADNSFLFFARFELAYMLDFMASQYRKVMNRSLLRSWFSIKMLQIVEHWVRTCNQIAKSQCWGHLLHSQCAHVEIRMLSG